MFCVYWPPPDYGGYWLNYDNGLDSNRPRFCNTIFPYPVINWFYSSFNWFFDYSSSDMFPS